LRHPDLFGAVYALSPAWIEDEAVQDLPPGAGTSVHDRAEFARANFADRAAIAISAGFADEAGPAPLFVDVTARERWIQHLPVENGRRLRAIAIDYGKRDEFARLPVTARDLATKLRAAGATVELDEYDGSHSSRIGERVTAHLLPFFQRLFAAAP
jgi:enterochelin esterase-like enzyme